MAICCESFDRLVSKSVRETLTDTESSELCSALCDPEAWSRASETYGLSRIIADVSTTCRSADDVAFSEVQRFGSLIIKNPDVADWFSVFCSVSGGMCDVRKALVGASPTEAFKRGVDEIASGCGGGQCADDAMIVAAAAICSGVIASVRTAALLCFFRIY